MKNYNYKNISEILVHSFAGMVFKGLQTTLNKNYNKHHRVIPFTATPKKNQIEFQIALPDGVRKKFRLRVCEVKKDFQKKI